MNSSIESADEIWTPICWPTQATNVTAFVVSLREYHEVKDTWMPYVHVHTVLRVDWITFTDANCSLDIQTWVTSSLPKGTSRQI